jgi:hypothetical protein
MAPSHVVRWLLIFQVVVFLLASALHRDWLIAGYAHASAAVAESVIGAVLMIGAVATVVRPKSWRAIAIAVQAFALLGTLVGAAMIAIGIGPHSRADIVIHAVMLSALFLGLLAALRNRAS